MNNVGHFLSYIQILHMYNIQLDMPKLDIIHTSIKRPRPNKIQQQEPSKNILSFVPVV